MKDSPPSLKNRDTAMALTFLALLLFLFKEHNSFLYAALVILLIGMTAPTLFSPLSTVWFGLGSFLGEITSRIILFVTYLLFVTPVAIIKRGHWTSKFKHFNKHSNPLHFTQYPKPYKRDDITKPY